MLRGTWYTNISSRPRFQFLWVYTRKHQRIDASKVWCWRRLLRIPWTGRRTNQSILKDINPEYSLEGLKLKLQYFGHLMQRADLLEKTPMLGKIEGRRRRGRQKMRWLDDIINSMDMNQANSGDGGTWHTAVHGVAKSRTRLKRLSSSSRSSTAQQKYTAQWR